MNMKTWLPLCLALVLGLIAAKYAHDLMAKNKPDASDGNLAQVVVARQPIGAGEALTSDNCQIGRVSKESVPDQSFEAIPALDGRVAQVQMSKGQPIVENLLAPKGTGTGLQAIVPKGMRAISIEINEFSGVGGMLVPGAHVDVIATIPGSSGGEMISRTIVQNIQISAVGQRMISQPDRKGDEPQAVRSVTLLATPSEAEGIELATTSGRPRLVLRNNNDQVLATTSGVTAANLRGQSMPKVEPILARSEPIAPVAPVSKGTSVKVIRGTTESEVWFSDGSSSRTAPEVNKAVSGADASSATGNH